MHLLLWGLAWQLYRRRRVYTVKRGWSRTKAKRQGMLSGAGGSKQSRLGGSNCPSAWTIGMDRNCTLHLGLKGSANVVLGGAMPIVRCGRPRPDTPSRPGCQGLASSLVWERTGLLKNKTGECSRSGASLIDDYSPASIRRLLSVNRPSICLELQSGHLFLSAILLGSAGPFSLRSSWE